MCRHMNACQGDVGSNTMCQMENNKMESWKGMFELLLPQMLFLLLVYWSHLAVSHKLRPQNFFSPLKSKKFFVYKKTFHFHTRHLLKVYLQETYPMLGKIIKNKRKHPCGTQVNEKTVENYQRAGKYFSLAKKQQKLWSHYNKTWDDTSS